MERLPPTSAYLHSKWHLNASSHLATSDMARKLGAVPIWGRGAGSPSNTMWPGPRPTCMPSFIFICPTVWPQYTNVTDRTDRQTGLLLFSVKGKDVNESGNGRVSKKILVHENLISRRARNSRTHKAKLCCAN